VLLWRRNELIAASTRSLLVVGKGAEGAGIYRGATRVESRANGSGLVVTGDSWHGYVIWVANFLGLFCFC
jgi:hypothetical protein